ncbi:hypothetical protein PP175_26325 (plasmid) [Aneurinibacillus sp. Ricciae_BoGa-3]|uniref:hypothetical protein n=1 Tax=Aneurinibacillus sp. Ricciae_BoGa-3 TaxID=3022697 RepID=UPI0023425FFF|nr:hypothetical protein [Aneurinibacillus sp. Ricciae_BoGa-3]WCK57584.1 hypothetical protein PP175_26325 [Aneurinibacillus sp. Ricciae_BoGa-3]
MTYDHEWNERKAIHFRMTKLDEEMQAIREEYKRLFQRLRELDHLNLEQEPDGEIPLNDSVNNKVNPVTSTNETIVQESNKKENEFAIVANQNPSEQMQTSTMSSFSQDKEEQEESDGMQEALELLNNPPEPNPKSWKYRYYLILQALREKRTMDVEEIRSLLREKGLISNLAPVLSSLVKKYTVVQKKEEEFTMT